MKSRATGHQNPTVNSRVLNFCLAIHVKNSKAFDFVSVDLGLLSMIHVQCDHATHQEPVIINHTGDGMSGINCKHINSIHEMSETNPCAFSAGINATSVVNAGSTSSERMQLVVVIL